MIEKLNYSGDCCSSGVLISFSGFDLALDERYKVLFDNVHTIPTSTNVRLNPTGYFLSSSETAPVLSTFFTSKSNFSDNSSLNIIRLSIYDSQNVLVHTDYKSISCQNLCGSGVPVTPTPTNTPTHTPTPTPTKTPAPPPAPPLNIQASFDKTVNKFAECQMLVRAKAYGSLNQTYSYSFGTDMQGVDLKISSPSGKITITELPTYVYTTITLPEKDKKYSLEFGLSDGTNNVQAAAIFSCVEGAISNTSLVIPPAAPPSPEYLQLPIIRDYQNNLILEDGLILRFRRLDDNSPAVWRNIYVPKSSLSVAYIIDGLNETPTVGIDFTKVLPNGDYQVEYDIYTSGTLFTSSSSNFSALNTNPITYSGERHAYVVSVDYSPITSIYQVMFKVEGIPGVVADPVYPLTNGILNGSYSVPASIDVDPDTNRLFERGEISSSVTINNELITWTVSTARDMISNQDYTSASVSSEYPRAIVYTGFNAGPRETRTAAYVSTVSGEGWDQFGYVLQDGVSVSSQACKNCECGCGGCESSSDCGPKSPSSPKPCEQDCQTITEGALWVWEPVPCAGEQYNDRIYNRGNCGRLRKIDKVRVRCRCS